MAGGGVSGATPSLGLEYQVKLFIVLSNLTMNLNLKRKVNKRKLERVHVSLLVFRSSYVNSLNIYLRINEGFGLMSEGKEVKFWKGKHIYNFLLFCAIILSPMNTFYSIFLD